LRLKDFGTHVTGVGYGVWANLVCGVVSAGCVALGLAQSPDMGDPKNWASWAVLAVIFGGITFVGAGVNGARFWLKKRNIERSPGDLFTFILADLVGDDSSRNHKQDVRNAIERGFYAHIISYPQVLEIAEGSVDVERTKTEAVAQKILESKRGDLLIWGRVKSANVVVLHFTRRSDKTRYRPFEFDRSRHSYADLSEAISDVLHDAFQRALSEGRIPGLLPPKPAKP
jgi:hypothetical protein